MNERFENLMYQSGLTAQGCWEEMDSYDCEAIEKFAKLIVRECAQIADEPTSQPFGSYGEKIKQYFGVEE